MTRTAALLIIGNEILSGRTQDLNAAYIGKHLSNVGIPLEEIRVVSDVESRIVNALNALRQDYDYVFTTGGIGPTHDDITSAAIAKAFSRDYVVNQDAKRLLTEYYGTEHLNEGRLKMAMMPADSSLIINSISAAPGFRTDNVFVMAGIPRIMQAMFDAALPLLEHGAAIASREVQTPLYESAIADILTALQLKYEGRVSVGSYPSTKEGFKGVCVVLRGTDTAALDEAAEALRKSLTSIEAQTS